jgi:hypothetical protein
VTDELGSYAGAHRKLAPNSIHDISRYTNNRAELSRQPTRVREPAASIQIDAAGSAIPGCPFGRRQSIQPGQARGLGQTLSRVQTAADKSGEESFTSGGAFDLTDVGGSDFSFLLADGLLRVVFFESFFDNILSAPIATADEEPQVTYDAFWDGTITGMTLNGEVPAPATLGLLLAGLAGLFARRRRAIR